MLRSSTSIIDKVVLLLPLLLLLRCVSLVVFSKRGKQRQLQLAGCQQETHWTNTVHLEP